MVSAGRAGGPTLFAHGGIHAGEIDGKDAGLMFLRDLTRDKAHLLERARFVFIPILNVDGHERVSPHGRVNQRGPDEMGWRTNARNLNLNRDFAKLDTPEVRALVATLRDLDPELYLDLHVTDGIDQQYDVTYGANGPHAWSPPIARWLQRLFEPAVERALSRAGHIPGPFFWPNDRSDLSKGVFVWTATPRYSNGYGDARHLPTVLVENHSLKPYRQRVLGTYVLLEAALRLVGQRGRGLRRMIQAARKRRPATVPLSFKAGARPRRRARLKTVSQQTELSPISGAPVIRYTGEPTVTEAPLFVADRAATTARRPVAYWIPPAWPEVIERLRLHGIRMETTTEPRTLSVEMFRLTQPVFAKAPFEGRTTVTARPVPTIQKETFPAGSVRVPTDQPLGTLAMLLLEPGSPDAFVSWGFFNEIFSRTEYVEPYVIEPLATRMLAEDPRLRTAFEAKLKDPAFRGDPAARLRWFYERSPYHDERHQLYPVGRELTQQ